MAAARPPLLLPVIFSGLRNSPVGAEPLSQDEDEKEKLLYLLTIHTFSSSEVPGPFGGADIIPVGEPHTLFVRRSRRTIEQKNTLRLMSHKTSAHLFKTETAF